jgi:hypothetical protein
MWQHLDLRPRWETGSGLFIEINMACDICDTNWVCETHPDKPSDITSDRQDACHCGGAAMPCRACGGDFPVRAETDMHYGR